MKKNRKSNLLLLLFFASSVVLLVVAIAVDVMMMSTTRMVEESTQGEMTALSLAVAGLVTGEELDLFQDERDMQLPQYQALREDLDTFATRSGVMYAYYMRLDTQTDKMQFIVDNVLSPADLPDGLDSPQVDREDGPDRALLGEAHAVDLGSYSHGWDGVLTAWAPVYYSDGTPSNMVAGVDMEDTHVRTARTNMYTLALVLAASLIIVLASCLFTLVMYRDMARQYQVASEAKSSFLSRMSHEMRTPMNAILGLCGMAEATDDTRAIREYLGNIRVASEHLRHVIDDVLDISKIESGKMALEYVPVDLLEEMGQVEQLIRPQTDEKGQAFAVKITPDVPRYLEIDATHVRQVVVNLLANAVKFTPKGGKITLMIALLETHEGRSHLTWRVRDTGIGIDEESQKRLFTAFEQGDVSTTRKYGGTGLGLAISRQLIELMGGQIQVFSTPGKGSEFVFDIWARHAGEEDVERLIEASHAQDGPLDLTGRHILLVEDSEMNQMIAENLLTTLGARVDIAENGEAGLRLFIEDPTRYDLIFMDIQMPVMDGYTATRNIRVVDTPRATTVPIIAMTANVFREDVERAMASGMNGHVGKPFDVEMIKVAIRKALAGEPDRAAPPSA